MLALPWPTGSLSRTGGGNSCWSPLSLSSGFFLHGSRVLRPDRTGSARPAWAPVAIPVRPHAGFTFAASSSLTCLHLPFAVQPLIASFESLDRRLLDASSISRQPPAHIFPHHVRSPGPDSSPPWSSALRTRSEFGVVLMVGGNLPGITRTVSIDIYDGPALDFAAANHTRYCYWHLVYRAGRRLRHESPRVSPWLAK